MLALVGAFSDFLIAVALSPWALVVLAALLIIDGFLPIVPGETTVVVLATLGASGHGPAPWTVLVVGVAATTLGDGIAFLVGRRIGIRRWRWMRRPKSMRVVGWAASHIERRPSAILITAKFIPYARVAVTMAAGASTLLVSRYLPRSLAAATLYTLYHVVIATTSGTLFRNDPFLALLLSVGFGLSVSGVSAGIRAIVRRAEGRRRRGSAPEHASDGAPR